MGVSQKISAFHTDLTHPGPLARDPLGGGVWVWPQTPPAWSSEFKKKRGAEAFEVKYGREPHRLREAFITLWKMWFVEEAVG